jgi:hypothetical protein
MADLVSLEAFLVGMQEGSERQDPVVVLCALGCTPHNTPLLLALALEFSACSTVARVTAPHPVGGMLSEVSEMHGSQGETPSVPLRLMGNCKGSTRIVTGLI